MTYRCTKQLILNMYDDDGASREEQMVIEEGEIFEVREDLSYLYVAAKPAIHLENSHGTWIEIYPETLSAHFEEVKE